MTNMIELKCSECGCEMEHSVEVEREEYFTVRYHIWKCPECGHVHTEED